MNKKFVKFVSQSGDGMIFNNFYEVVEELVDAGFQSGKGFVVVNSDGALQAYESTMFDTASEFLKLKNNLSGVPSGTCVSVIKEYSHPAVQSGHGYAVRLLVDNGTKKLVRIQGDPYFE